jgi:hypothetical protein
MSEKEGLEFSLAQTRKVPTVSSSVSSDPDGREIFLHLAAKLRKTTYTIPVVGTSCIEKTYYFLGFTVACQSKYNVIYKKKSVSLYDGGNKATNMEQCCSD